MKKGHTIKWTLVNRRHQKQQQPVPKPNMTEQQLVIPPVGAGEQGQPSKPQTLLNGQEQTMHTKLAITEAVPLADSVVDSSSSSDKCDSSTSTQHFMPGKTSIGRASIKLKP
ncbi:UNVERIFIED_CONTAM: hypothetical protein Sangu_2721200 [Sesamum angustifolium]|uniref:Uncharacterized protein n=1 Tax=Sesamum angustifolium TaxID=2727405 RepID=A0AAW2IXC6_9LAMI